MRILHAWDCAGVASILAKYQRKLGHTSDVLMRSSSDKLHISEFYGNIQDLSGREFLKTVVKKSKDYDIIHVHNLPELVFYIKIRHPRKKVILHIHGSSVFKKKHYRLHSLFADRILLATSDLQKFSKKGMVLPTIVDTDHFFKSTIGRGSLSFTIRYLDEKKFRFHTKDEDINIIDRETNAILYSEMPGFLRQYDTYYDIKYFFGKLLKAHSKTCYEALACGLKVVDWKGSTLTELPEENEPENVAKKCMELYK